MSKATATRAKKKEPARITLEALRKELAKLRERVEDLEDLRELNGAIERNKDKPLVPWEDAKKDLGIEG